MVLICMLKILAVIPARGGSKGVPKKNIKMLGGKPLVAHSIEAAKNSSFVDRTVVTTDSEEIGRVAKQFGAEVIIRPQELAQDKTPMDPVVEHVVSLFEKDGYSPDAVLLLQPTSPLRTASHVEGAIQAFSSGNFDSLISIFKIYNNRHEAGKDGLLTPTFTKSKNRNERPPAIFENGAIYISTAPLIKEGRIRGDRIGYYEMDQYSSVDIDTLLDFVVAEQLLIAREKHGGAFTL